MKLFNTFKLNVDKHPSIENIKNMDNPNFPPQDWIKMTDKWKSIRDEDYAKKYIQTQGLYLYLKYAIDLIEKGYTYLCFLSEDELQSAKATLPKYQPFRFSHSSLNRAEIDWFIAKECFLL